MLRPESQPSAVDAWLSGELSPDEAAELESQLEKNPDHVATERQLYEESGLDPSLLHRIAEKEPEKELTELVARVKSGLSCEAYSPARDAWKELVEPSEKPGVLGLLGGYEIVDVIATGAMGIVLKGFDEKLNRFAAIKILSPEAASNSTARERFLREARAAAQLEHDNILPIYEVREDAVPWFAMRFVDGGNLQDRIDGGEGFDAAALKELGRQIALGLAAAHEKGMVHRDIKPGNILLSAEDGHVWIGDFGIVRCIEDPSLTYPGAIAGTPRFMSPEQATGGELDERSDLFSFGLVLYLCATGRNLLDGKTTSAVLAELGKSERLVDPKNLSHLPAWLRNLIVRLLERDPANRPASAREVASILESESDARPRAVVSRKTLLATGGAIGVAALLAAAFLMPEAGKVTISPEVRAGSILIEETGERFEHLGNALDSLTGKSTLLLEGELKLLRQVEIRHEVTLRAAPGARPTVTVRLPIDHGLYFFRPFTLEGIRFVRDPTMAHSMPIIGSNFPEGAALIDRCEFVLLPEPGEQNATGRGIGFTETSRAIIRNCLFDVKGGSAVFLATNTPGSTHEGIEIENCLFTGRCVLELHSWQEPGSIQVSLRDSVIFTEHLIYRPWGEHIPKLSMNLTDNIVATRDALAFYRDSSLSDLGGFLKWKGEGNTYRSGTNFLGGVALKTIGDQFPNLKETAPEFRTLPVRDPQAPTPTAAELLRKMDLPADSTGARTLRSFTNDSTDS